MGNRWDCMAVVCIEPIEGLRVGSTYKVKGQGNLEWNAGTDRLLYKSISELDYSYDELITPLIREAKLKNIGL